MTEPTPAAADLAALVDEEVNLAAAADRIAERRATIKAVLLKNLPIGTHTVGAHEVQVRAGQNRLNTSKVAANYPPDGNPELYSLTLDTTKVKHHLAPAELAGYTDATAASVVVKS